MILVKAPISRHSSFLTAEQKISENRDLKMVRERKTGDQIQGRNTGKLPVFVGDSGCIMIKSLLY